MTIKEPPLSALDGLGPGMNQSQGIGNDARAALYANAPRRWVLAEFPGDDFGYDFSVTCFQAGEDEHANADARLTLNLQLKGTTKVDARSADGTFLSQAIQLSTIRMWHNSQIPIVLVVVDLIDSRDPRCAKVHYRFLSPELDELLDSLPANQASTVVRVPTANIVHRELDLLPDLMAYVEEGKEARRQLRRERRAAGDATESVAPNVGIKTQQFVELEVSGDFDEFIETLASHEVLREALQALRYGDYDRVLSTIELHDESERHRDTNDTAARAFLRARAYESQGADADARVLYQLAFSLASHNDAIAGAAYQRQLDDLEIDEAGASGRQSLLASMPESHGPAVASVKARLLALSGSCDGARQLLASYPRKQTSLSYIVVSIVECNWSRALNEIGDAREDVNLRPRTRLSLLLLEARAMFELALEAVARSDGQFIVPRGGLPGIDFEQLRIAYDVARSAMLEGQRLSWPQELHLVLDVLAISATVLGREREAVDLIGAFAVSRPYLPAVRDVAMKMAVQSDDPVLAVRIGEARGRSPMFEQEELVLAVAYLKSGNTSKALEVVDEKLLSRPTDTDIFLSSLMMLGVAADQTLRSDLVESIRTRLTHTSASRNYKAILECVIDTQHSLLKRPAALLRLLEFWRSNQQPNIVSHHLLLNADSTDAKDAMAVLEVAAHLEREVGLTEEQEVTVVQAHLTLGQTEDALRRLLAATTRFRESAELKSLLGLVWELRGEPARAFGVLGEVLEQGLRSESARHTYVNIAISMGFFSKAEQQVREALAGARTRNNRLSLLQTLFQLIQAAADRPQELEAIAWELGQISQQDVEREEGIFLLEYLLATAPSGVHVLPVRRDELQRRLQVFTDRFPDSNYLRKVQLPAESPPPEFLAAMRSAMGLTEADVQRANAIERQLDTGMLQVPFSWRPRTFLREISDVFMLWQVRQTARRERAALHLSSSAPAYDRGAPASLREMEPVLSMTSLLVLGSLKLLDLVLSTFPRIVIARSTVMKLQQARGALGGIWCRDLTESIRISLQSHFERIVHPPSTVPLAPGPHWHAEEIAAMQLSNRVYFCDDVVETFMVCNRNDASRPLPSMSVVEFLERADAYELIRPAAIARMLADLIHLNVGGIRVELRYLVAAIPDDLQSASSRQSRSKAWQSAECLNAILDGLWDQQKNFADLRSHFGEVMAYLIAKGHARAPVLEAFWLRWLQAVRLHSEYDAAPTRKLAAGFIAALEQLPDERNAIEHLWQSFWSALAEGLGTTLTGPEDQTGVDAVAEMLGAALANPQREDRARILFNRARLGLESGTELYTRMSERLISSAAEATRRQKAASNENG